jgi:chemotaxis family two-component system response regulator Rcp1
VTAFDVTSTQRVRPVRILLVEDSPSDVAMTVDALREGRVATDVTVATDGEMALAMLRRAGAFSEVDRPDVILLDLNLPRMGGREVLEVVKNDDDLKAIPVVVLTSSGAAGDIGTAYDLHANAYLRKSIGFEGLRSTLAGFETFWLTLACLPAHQPARG